ncbi:hypothetical protein BO70DRAFT_363756 [Aspergillus heteromorphus CBS 117.55]|uniref:Eisosome protein 1 n=1 Tax=Aspergillus heteromorphus CBS 117.55 TaxID=1448321 RepID=A0A317VPA4_9EURO|nr:uncharacterized protein BO70DRAFT_363756 [Aspergillus heteromorphus CBS 117.55]PWY76193.1 hypothetical protein BO70DRAFT_363756 [Aspergillus heteromorphus CBS 117.55]
MATLEQPVPVQRTAIPRSRSARLTSQAATAALYVTHPERRLSVREPSAAETELSTLKATGSRPGFSHASAVAALAHARSRGQVTKETAAAQDAGDNRLAEGPSLEGYKAAAFVFKDRQAVSSVPTVSPVLKYDITGSGQTADAYLGATGRDRALHAATGALYANRKRSDSAPSEAPRAGMDADDVLGDIGSAMEASRIQHISNTNARLYTASPPVAPEVEEYKRKSILQAAAVSMARDMYAVVEAKEQGQVGLSRIRSQRSVTGAEPMALQQAFSLQDMAQKRAAEKLASMQDETAVYREYYGIEPQTTRPSLQVRRRRTSIDTDVSSVDAERSKEIRNQMYSLRSKLDAVDERREKDRALLMEAARKNVDAAIQDMEMRVYADTGRAPAARQKAMEEAALAHAKQERQETTTQYPLADRVNISSGKYVDMADVEALARSRLQPTFDEIADRAEAQRARELEQRLDQEEAERQEAIEREREADTRAEEKRLKALLKLESKSREEKAWLWSRKLKRASDNAPDERYTATGAMDGAADEVPAEARPQQTDKDAGAAVSGAVAETGSSEAMSKSESKLKSWLKGRLGRRSSGGTAEPAKGGKDESPEGAGAVDTEAATQPQEAAQVSGDEEVQEARPKQETEGGQGRTWDIAHPAGEVPEVPELPAAPAVSATPAVPEASTEGAVEDESRRAPLRSHPVTSMDLRDVQIKVPSADEGHTNGAQGEDQAAQRASNSFEEPAADSKRKGLMSGFKKVVSKNAPEAKTNGVGSNDMARRSSQAIPTLAVEADRGESATDPGLTVPAATSKRLSSGRESRFSEKL